MAQAARPPEPKLPNPCAALRPPLPPWPARPKDAPCPTSSGDRGHSGQLKKGPDNVMHKPSGGTYSKPEARVKLIPTEEITYVRHGKTFGRTVGSDNLEKRHCRRSVTPPPSSHKVCLARSTPLTHKATMPLPHKAATPLSQKSTTPLPHKATMRLPHKSATPLPHKSATPLSHKVMMPLSHKVMTPLTHMATAPLAHKPTSPLTHKPTSPPPPVASCLSAKRFETAENRQIVSLNRPSPVFKAVQRGAIPTAVLRKESEMTLISPSSVHVLPAHSSKVPIGTKAGPSSNTKLCSTSNQATLMKPSLLSPTSVLSISSREVCPGSRSSGVPLILHAEPHRKTYRPDACWKGKFEVTGELTHTCDELEAHFPLEIFIKVYEASKQMPEVLKLEALPLSHLLPKKFKMEPPDAQDIGLCFIRSDQRPNENFDHLLENVSSHIGLRTDIGTTELLIFSSKLLREDDQTKDGKLYFCGVFRKPLRKKQYQANNHTDNVDISNSSLSKGDSHVLEDIGMNSDMTCGKYIGNRCQIGMKLDETGVNKPKEIGMKLDEAGVNKPKEIGMKLDETGVNKPKEIGKVFDMATDKQTERMKCKKSGIRLGLTGEEETNRVNKCLPMLKTPDANAVINAAPAVSFFTGSCSPDSAGSPCKSAARAPACVYTVLDSPSRFSVDVPPGFTRPHCGLRTGETAESQIASSSSLVLDTRGFALDVPPGFTSAHCGLHTNDAITSPGSENGVSTLFSEKKPPIKFSLNITKAVQTDAPPGFAKLLQVKKEPGLPAFTKATDKIAPIRKVNEKKINHDKVDVEVDDGSEERQFPKIKRLSDILGFSSASSSNNTSTSSRPRNCSEVCRSAAPVPSASKFQETGPPEKEKLCRKRGQPEPSEPSAAEAAKRLKVNGRIALNKAQGNGGKS